MSYAGVEGMRKKKIMAPIEDLDDRSYFGVDEEFDTDSGLDQWTFLEGYSRGYNGEV